MEPNDHRILGKRLDLFHFEESAPGMIYWHAEGWKIYRRLEDFIRARMEALDYQEVRSPQLLPQSLWQQSGHWEKFSASMYALEDREEGGRPMALKPMSCPCHLQIFNQGLRSWRDLPMRFAEFGICHRYEASGAMHGLMRSRAFEQDDAHVVCRPSQVEGEVERFVALLREVYAFLGFEEISIGLSLRPDLRAGSDEDWDRAEAGLLAAARAAGLEPVLQPGEGAFYGPKLEFALKDRQGRSWQCGTIQLDMVLPGRLGASYIDEAGKPQVPVMLHHAVLGSMGRFIGILLEHYEGRLPLWLAPCQVAVLPIAQPQEVMASALMARLRAAGLRAKLLSGGQSLQRRLVEAHERLIPIHAVIGQREAEAGRVMLQMGDEKIPLSCDDAIAHIRALC